MAITFGKHKGTTEEIAVFRWPDYVSWVLAQPNPTGPMIPLAARFRTLIDAVDRKPFLKRCHGCGKPATRFSLYRNDVSPYWWCNDCDPYSSGAIEGRLSVGRSYRDALNHVKYTCGNTATQARAVIRTLAEAKGLPKRLSAKAAVGFFS